MQRPGHRPVPHRLHHLDDPADPGRGLGMADVRLQRAQQKRLPRGPVLAVDGDQRLRLDGVAEPGAGAVRLHHVHLGGPASGGRQGLADDALLGGAAGRGQAVAGAVLAHGRAPYDGEDPVPVAAGVPEALDEQQAHALRPGGAVRRGGERLAAAVRRQPALPTELQEHARRRHHRDTAGQRQLAFALAQRLDREVQRDQRGGAGGVHGDRRTLKAEGVRQPARGHARGAARQQMAVVAVGGLVQARPVVLVRGADEHAGVSSAQPLGGDTGALEGLPGGLQQQPLLGVHRLGLARTDPEQRGVEVARPLQEPALTHVRGAGGGGIGVVQGGQVPAAVGGERPDGVGARGDHVPQVLG